MDSKPNTRAVRVGGEARAPEQSKSPQFGFLGLEARLHLGQLVYCEDLMIIEINDDETRLLYNVLLEKALEDFGYATTSEVAERLYKLAARFGRPVRELPNITIA